MTPGCFPAFSIASWILLFSVCELGTQAAGNDPLLAQEMPYRVSLPQMVSCCRSCCCCYYWNLPRREQLHVSPDHLVVILLPTWLAHMVYLHIKIFVKFLSGRERDLWVSPLFCWGTYKNCAFNKTWEPKKLNDWVKVPEVVSDQARTGMKAL